MSHFLEDLLATREPIPSLGRPKVDPQRKHAFMAATSRKNIRPALIAEIKHATPRIPRFDGDLIPVSERAKRYAEAGADAISVVVEHKHFCGDYKDIAQASAYAPVLAKGFFVTPVEIENASHMGASAVLLIAALSNHGDLRLLRAIAEQLGLAVVVEIHAVEELPFAMELKPDLIGINRRNLKTLEIAENAHEMVIPHVPSHLPIVIESHIRESLVGQPKEASAALVGSYLMEGCDLEQRMQRLLSPGDGKKILKFCGIRSVEDLHHAFASGATHIGINFIPRSKRYRPENLTLLSIPHDRARKKTVAVIDETTSPLDLQQISQTADILQFHAVHLTAEPIEKFYENLSTFSLPIWLAVSSPNQIPESFHGEAVIVDSSSGGSGIAHAHSPGEFRRKFSGYLVRAGGISQFNLHSLSVGWDGIDLASGIEENGTLSPRLMNIISKEFLC